MKLNLQLFAEETGDQEPQIPEELLGLPNQELVKEILEEEGLAEKEPVPEQEEPQQVSGEDLGFWKKKAEEMEKAMYEERAKRKTMRKDLDSLNQYVLRLQQNQLEGQKPKAQEPVDPLVQVVDGVVSKKLGSDPSLREVRDYIRNQREQQEMLQWAERSQREAQSRYGDFDDVTAPVVSAARQNPELARYILTQADPAEFAYTLGVRLKFEEMRQQEAQKRNGRLQEIAKHPRAAQVRGASSISPAGVDPDQMSVAEWEELKQANPQLVKKLLMGG